MDGFNLAFAHKGTATNCSHWLPMLKDSSSTWDYYMAYVVSFSSKSSFSVEQDDNESPLPKNRKGIWPLWPQPMLTYICQNNRIQGHNHLFDTENKYKSY